MCLNPITIKNPAKHKSGGLEYIQVPCRNCEECSNVAQMDYLVRCIVLFNSLPQNYSFFFCTLTFNNENLPRTNVYCRNSDGVWEIVESNVPTFNHVLYKRFRKNFQEFCMDTFGMPVYLLTTCEYGEKKKRPHYHCICAYPSNISWRLFKSVIERYWHYGFTKNIRIARYDNLNHDRSILNSIKYVCKYVTKFEMPWLPSYIKDESLCTDYPPFDIKPKVFITNGFGSCLESKLNHHNYVTNKVLLACKFEDSNPKTYHLPAYYRRRYFTRTSILDSVCLPYQVPDVPYADKITKKYVYRFKTETIRVNGYDEVLRDKFAKSVRQKIFDYNNLVDKYPKFREYMFEHEFAALPSDCLVADLHLSSTLEHDMMSCYDETYYSSLKPLVVQNYYFQHYLLPDDVQVRQRYCKHIIHEYDDCPWLPSFIKKFSYSVNRFVGFQRLPDDWYKVELAQLFIRCMKQNSSMIRRDITLNWYRQHHCECA